MPFFQARGPIPHSPFPIPRDPMIYRILLQGTDLFVFLRTRTGEVECLSAPDREPASKRLSTWDCLGSEMDRLGLKWPHGFSNRKARFYFTERGWDRIGRQLVKAATELGYKVKIVRKKQPKRSAVVYCDQYQLAVLDRKGKK